VHRLADPLASASCWHEYEAQPQAERDPLPAEERATRKPRRAPRAQNCPGHPGIT